VGNFCGTAPLPPAATSAAPGSEEKIAILAERAKNRLSLWHPDDVTLETVPASAAALAQACLEEINHRDTETQRRTKRQGWVPGVRSRGCPTLLCVFLCLLSVPLWLCG